MRGPGSGLAYKFLTRFILAQHRKSRHTGTSVCSLASEWIPLGSAVQDLRPLSQLRACPPDAAKPQTRIPPSPSLRYFLTASSKSYLIREMKTIALPLLGICLLSSCPSNCSGQAAPESAAQRHLDERMPVWLKAFNVTGVGIAYIEHGKIAWNAFYGDQVPGGPPASSTTLYSIASLTKPITAEIIDRLASAGKLSLDELTSPYWTDPDLKDNPWAKLLTPRICLTHQTGFPNWRYQ